jgi:pilus assembly protein CpaF
MRPDRIIIGECRAGETLDMLQAMNTGHDGSLTTVHANSPRDALSRIETMTLMAGFDLPARAVREQVSSALDLIVHLARLRDGTRRVMKVTEVGNIEGDVVLLQDIFVFDHRMGTDGAGRSLGQLKATGLRPQLTERLADRGVNIDPAVFEPEVDLRAPAGLAQRALPPHRINGWAR